MTRTPRPRRAATAALSTLSTLSALAALAVLATTATACAPAASNGPSAPAAEPMVLAFDPDLTSGVRQALIDRWNDQHPDHPARIVQLPNGTDLGRSQVVGALQSGTGGYDVVNMDVTWTAEFAEQGLIRPWPEPLDGDFLDSVTETVEYEGEVWGVPFNTDAALLYYRKDVLERENIALPTSWAGLDAAADRVEDGTDLAGYVSQFREYEGLTVNVMEAIWVHGGDLPASSDGDSDPAGAGAGAGDDMAAVREGIRDLRERLQYRMHEDSGTADESASVSAFADGEVVFMRNWPFAYERLAATMEDFEDRVGVTRLPWASALGGQNLAVTADAEDPAWARRLIEYLTGEDSERCLLERGFAATRESAYGGGTAERCELPAPAAPTPEAGTGGADGSASGPGDEEGGPATHSALPPSQYGMLLASLKAARTRPVTPYYAAFTRSVQSTVHTGLGGSADRAADRLAEDLGPILEGR